MRETELKLLFPTDKLEALRFFISKKELTVEQELRDYLDKTYERVVPANVREYVESRMEQETTQEQAAEPEQISTSRERQPRQTRRQREQAVAEIPSNAEVQNQIESHDQEEAQGMTMSM
jgi:hypothetical protein